MWCCSRRSNRLSAGLNSKQSELEPSLSADGNLMPAIIEAVHAYCTLGEICGAMKGVFGEYKALAAI